MPLDPSVATAPPVKRTGLRLPEGPKLQFLNLSILFAVVNLPFEVRFGDTLLLPKIDYPNPIHLVGLMIAVAAGLDAALSRWRFGEWRIPWPSMVATLGISLLLDFRQLPGWRIVIPFVLLSLLMVGSKHLIRWRGRHLFNPNNFAATLLILAVLARVGVNDWGAAPQTVFLMLLFGTVSTVRVKRFDVAIFYLALSFLVYWIVAQTQGWAMATVWAFAFAPANVVLAFFALTDPATSPNGRTEKLLWALLIVLVTVPAIIAGRPEAPVLALFLAAPQRHFVTYLVTGKWPPPEKKREPAPAAAPSASAPVQGGGAP